MHCGCFNWLKCTAFSFFASTLLFLLSVDSVSAQVIDYAGLDLLAGKVISNYPTFPKIEKPSVLISGYAGKLLNGSKDWHRYYNFPDLGVKVTYSGFGDNVVLGKMVAVNPQLIFTQNIYKSFSISEEVGIGFSYFTTHYNEATNPENIAIGSHLTAFAALGLKVNYRITDALSTCVSFNILHSSNSHVALPNVGLNTDAIGIGMRYTFSKKMAPVNLPLKPEYSKKLHLNINIGLGINEQGSSTIAVNGPKYPIYIASLFFTKKLSYVNKLQFGLEGYFNTGVYDFIVSQDLYGDNQKQKSYAGYVFAGDEFLLNHFGIVGQLGVYVYNPFYRDQHSLYYEDDLVAHIKTSLVLKLGINYYIWNPYKKDKNALYIGTYVKTNFGQADFWENCIGWQF